ncbi:MAG: DUF1353 domain-containing protein [Paracoccaceae bacterium]
MSSFTRPLQVYPASFRCRPKGWSNLLPPSMQKTRWVIGREIVYLVDSKETPKDTVAVPEGFLFDGLSVPWPVTLLIPKSHPAYLPAAALHDWLYVDTGWRGDRRYADAILHEALLVLGAPKLWARLIWLAVRAAGWAFWYPRRLRKGYDKSVHLVAMDGFLERRQLV